MVKLPISFIPSFKALNSEEERNFSVILYVYSFCQNTLLMNAQEQLQGETKQAHNTRKKEHQSINFCKWLALLHIRVKVVHPWLYSLLGFY